MEINMNYTAGTFSEFANARKLRDELTKAGIASRIDTRGSGAITMVFVAPRNGDAAVAICRRTFHHG